MRTALAIRDFALDLDDPRAPTVDQWERMTPDERERVVQMLPAEIPDALFAPEGDVHRKAKMASLDGLERHFRRMGRKVYLSSELGVYYPGTPRIVPDVLAVLDVEPGDRLSWMVTREGKGLDFILEVHVAGDWRKDHEANVARYAQLGIAEYFVFDRGHLRLRGYRLAGAGARTYQPILPQAGRYASQVLGLDLTIQESKLRFWLGDAPLQEAEEMIGKLGGMLDEVLTHKEEAERQAEEANRRAGELERQLADEQRLRTDAERQRTDAERQLADEQRLRADEQRRLAEALAEIERLRGGG